MAMTSSRPYLIRALYEWILDNKCTPYVLVDALCDGVEVPRQYVKDGQIVLNIAPTAVVDLKIENDFLIFNARFSGVATDVHVPMKAALGIYARENGQGMLFDNETAVAEERNQQQSVERAKEGQRPNLRIVK